MKSVVSCRRLFEDESGQALIYVALILAVLVTVIFAIFDLGRLTTAKIQAQNGADAAALAAVSVKISVHHTREMAYLAMTEEGFKARVELLTALSALGDVKGFQLHISRANAHIQKIKDLQKGLTAFNAWIDKAGPAIVADAARYGYVANVQGMNDHLTTAAGVEAANLREIDQPGALRENSRQEQTVGGVVYPEEGLGPHRMGGKSLVEVVPKYQGLNWSLLGANALGGPVDVPAWAAAGFVSSDDIIKDPATKAQAMRLGPFGLRWLSPRLVRTGQKNGGTFGGPGEGGHIVSQH